MSIRMTTFRHFSTGNHIFHALKHHIGWTNRYPVVPGLVGLLHLPWEQAFVRDACRPRFLTALEAPEVGSKVKNAFHDVVANIWQDAFAFFWWQYNCLTMNYRVGVILCSFYEVSISFGKYLTVLNFQTFPFHLLCINRPTKTNSWLDVITMSRCLFFFHVSCCTLENSEMWTEHIKLVGGL